jgi:hypothetical protein
MVTDNSGQVLPRIDADRRLQRVSGREAAGQQYHWRYHHRLAGGRLRKEVGHLAWLGRARAYLETVFLSLSAFFLVVPTVSETLRRVPDGHPFVTDLQSPVLIGAQAGIALVLVIGVTA